MLVSISHRAIRRVVFDTGDEDSDDETDASFWNSMEFIEAVLGPCFKLMRKTDSTAPIMGKVYKLMSELGGTLEDLFAGDSRWAKAPWLEYRDQIDSAHTDRWTYMHCDYHGAGYCLDPNFIGEDVNGINNGEAWAGLAAVIGRHYHDNEAAEVAATEQYRDFRQQKGVFANKKARVAARSWPAHEWWDLAAGGASELRRVAMKVLSKTTSASACERNWSAFAAVQTSKRTRLHSKTLNDLVYTRVNLRLQQSRRDPEFKAVVAEWMHSAATDSDDEVDAGVDEEVVLVA
jgi:hAT family C-terminal dimerisation region